MFTPLALILISARLIFAACPALPSPLPAPTALPEINVIPDPWTFFNGSRVTTAEDWQCRRKELLTLAQEYFYGYYPDHANETVTATRSGNTLSVTVAAGGKTGTFSASLALPAGASKASPVPVAIAALFVDNAVFINNGIAVVTFNTAGVAADSDSKTGAFWNLYNGRDIGKCSGFVLHAPCPRASQVSTPPGHGDITASSMGSSLPSLKLTPLGLR